MAMSSGTYKFWIVISDERGPSESPYRHGSERDAFEEAQRLARTHSGKFYVLEAIGASVKLDVRTERFNEDEHIPF